MKRSRFNDSQIMAVLKQAETGTRVPDLRREYGMSTATFYKWRAKFGGMDVSLMAKMKALGTWVSATAILENGAGLIGRIAAVVFIAVA